MPESDEDSRGLVANSRHEVLDQLGKTEVRILNVVFLQQNKINSKDAGGKQIEIRESRIWEKQPFRPSNDRYMIDIQSMDDPFGFKLANEVLKNLSFCIDFFKIQNAKRDISNTIISETEITSDLKSPAIQSPRSRSVLSATSQAVQATFLPQSPRPALVPPSVPLTDLEYAAKFRSEILQEPELIPDYS